MIETSETTPNSGAKPRLVFFGNERIATGTTTTNPVLRMLLAEGYDIAAIVLHHTFGASRNQRELEVLAVAEEHNIPIHYPEKLSEFTDKLASFGALAGVLVAFGKIVPQATIDVFPRGIINIHPSALPKHRGPTPVESVLLAGERETAVSVMALAREMDAGPVYAQAPVELAGDETKQALADHLLEVSAETLRAVLPEILNDDCVAAPQSHADATYDKLIEKHDGVIDLSKTAEQLEREIRAYAGWPKSKLVVRDIELTVLEAHTAPQIDNPENKTLFVVGKQLCLQTADGVLVLDTVQPAGKKPMPATAFLAGYKTILE